MKGYAGADSRLWCVSYNNKVFPKVFETRSEAWPAWLDHDGGRSRVVVVSRDN